MSEAKRRRLKSLLHFAKVEQGPEAEKAAELAQKLMTELQIDEADLDSITDEPIMQLFQVKAGPLYLPRIELLVGVSSANTVEALPVVDEPGCVVLIGFSSDIDRVIGLYEALEEHCSRECKASPDRRKGSRRWIYSFHFAYAIRIRELLERARRATIQVSKPGSELALRDRSAQVRAAADMVAIEEESRNSYTFDAHAFVLGTKAAEQADI